MQPAALIIEPEAAIAGISAISSGSESSELQSDTSKCDNFFRLAREGGTLQILGFDGMLRDVRDVNMQHISSQTASVTGTLWN